MLPVRLLRWRPALLLAISIFATGCLNYIDLTPPPTRATEADVPGTPEPAAVFVQGGLLRLSSPGSSHFDFPFHELEVYRTMGEFRAEWGFADPPCEGNDEDRNAYIQLAWFPDDTPTIKPDEAQSGRLYVAEGAVPEPDTINSRQGFLALTTLTLPAEAGDPQASLQVVEGAVEPVIAQGFAGGSTLSESYCALRETIGEGLDAQEQAQFLLQDRQRRNTLIMIDKQYGGPGSGDPAGVSQCWACGFNYWCRLLYCWFSW